MTLHTTHTNKTLRVSPNRQLSISSLTMCKMTKIDTPLPPPAPAVADENKLGAPVNNKKGQLVKKELKKSASSSGGSSRAAFAGAKFDKAGYCLRHPTCQLVNPMKDDRGKLVYQELKLSCPSCQSIKHKKKKTTSLGGGKVRTGHRVHGTPSSASSRSRSKSREPASRSRSKSRDGRGNGNGDKSSRKEHATPFDSKGRCHHHKNVQLAAKKQFGGGWKVLHSVCPKCMEDTFDDDDDDKSVRSSSSRRSTRSATSCSSVLGNAHGEHDKNGCCKLHTHIQVAKRPLFGRGWKVIRVCPACEGGQVDEDDYSVKSGKSARSTSSRKSTRSVRSTASRGKPGKAQKSGRYGALPFDGDGYCCQHPNVQLAKKKALGGFKIIHNICPECDTEGGGGGARSRSGRKKPSRRKSGTGRMFDDSGSDCSSSFKSGKQSSSGGSTRKKRIRVRNLKTEDEEGKHGRYSGYVNDEHQPHGDGVMKYEDGSVYDGVWSEGSKVHGKTKKR